MLGLNHLEWQGKTGIIQENKKYILFYIKISFKPKVLSIAPKTLANFLERAAQLYDQGVQTIDASGNTSGIGGDG